MGLYRYHRTVSLGAFSKSLPKVLLAFGLSLATLGTSSLESPKTEPADENAIIFAGLSGNPPKYIETGPLKGYGWIEYQTKEVRAGLVSEGFQVRQEWMTPARITHEFQTKRPICTFPVVWSPKKILQTRPDRIYSIPLSLSAEASRSILFKREDLPRFRKHFDKKGDIDIKSLLSDSSLKTMLIRDKDYGALNSLLTTRESNGDQIVREAYQKQVSLRVINDNRQIIEMLNAKRFDYTFYDEIEFQDFMSTRIAQESFLQVNFETTSIQDQNDAGLLRVSIACSDHPISIKAMPHINRWIALSRGLLWMQRKLDYQKSLDPRVTYSQDYRSTGHARFRAELESGQLDLWYTLQQKYFPNLKLYPDRETLEIGSKTLSSSQDAEPSPPTNTPGWIFFSETPSSLTIGTEAGFALGKLDTATSRAYWGQIYPTEKLGRYLTPPQQEGMRRAKQSEASPLSRLSSREIKKRITLFARGASLDDLQSLLSQLRQSPVEELLVFGASPKCTGALLDALPDSLIKLNLTGSSLADHTIEVKVKNLKRLRELHLTDTQISPESLTELLKALPDSIEALSLGYLRSSWTPKAVRAFGSRIWSRLKYLDLENNFLFDSDLLQMMPGFPLTLEVLRVGLNSFSPKSLGPLLSRAYPSLTELDLSQSDLGSSRVRIQLPKKITRLTLRHAGLSSTRLQNVILPPQLQALDLADNALGTGGEGFLAGHLSRKMEVLDLSHTQIRGESFTRILKQNGTEFIRSLRAAQNAWTDQDISSLASTAIRMTDLDLNENHIGSTGAGIIGATWGKGLQSLLLSTNPIGKAGVRALASALGPNLLDLNLAFLLEVDIQALSQALPKGLRALDLGGNLLTDHDLEALLPKIPSQLETLDLSHSAFGPKGAALLAKYLPQKLTSLDLTGTPLSELGTVELFRQFPQSLSALKLGNAVLSQDSFATLCNHLPKGLQDLWVQSLQVENQAGSSSQPANWRVFFEALPPSLTRLRMKGVNFSIPAGKTPPSFFWPEHLREIVFEGMRADQDSLAVAFSNIPKTAQRLTFFATELSDQVIQSMISNDLARVTSLTIMAGRLPPSSFSRLWELKSVRVLEFTEIKFDAGFFTRRKWTPSPQLRIFNFGGMSITEKDLVAFLKVLPENLKELDLPSNGITHHSIQSVLKVIPKGLRELQIFGNPIGQFGLDQLQALRNKREQEQGVTFSLLQ